MPYYQLHLWIASSKKVSVIPTTTIRTVRIPLSPFYLTKNISSHRAYHIELITSSLSHRAYHIEHILSRREHIILPSAIHPIERIPSQRGHLIPTRTSHSMRTISSQQEHLIPPSISHELLSSSASYPIERIPSHQKHLAPDERYGRMTWMMDKEGRRESPWLCTRAHGPHPSELQPRHQPRHDP